MRCDSASQLWAAAMKQFREWQLLAESASSVLATRLSALAEHRQLKRLAAPTAQNQKKKAKLNPEAQMRLGFCSFFLSEDSNDNDRTDNALRSTLHHSLVSPHDRRAYPPDSAPTISLKPR